jgi:riboflavin kinase/FMN adenylyltransferase
MKVAHSAGELDLRDKPSVAIGFFDGVHLGHQQIIRQAIADARQHNTAAVVLSFNEHPSTVVAPDQAPPLIQGRHQRIQSIAALGPDALLLLAFTGQFSRQPAEAFVHTLHAELGGLHSICIGSNFHFGHRRSGNLAVLEKLGAELGFRLHGIAAVGLEGSAISSTRIREAIGDGRLDEAGQMLGRPWSVAGPVVRGDGRGHELGFPTANLSLAGLAMPPYGVYAAQAIFAGQRCPAVINLGIRPTVSSGNPTPQLEAHLLDFAGELYGQELEVVPIKRLRGERRFGNVEELRQQIARDVTHARQVLG